jgi:hypothetical protein
MGAIATHGCWKKIPMRPLALQHAYFINEQYLTKAAFIYFK